MPTGFFIVVLPGESYVIREHPRPTGVFIRRSAAEGVTAPRPDRRVSRAQYGSWRVEMIGLQQISTRAFDDGNRRILQVHRLDDCRTGIVILA